MFASVKNGVFRRKQASKSEPLLMAPAAELPRPGKPRATSFRFAGHALLAGMALSFVGWSIATLESQGREQVVIAGVEDADPRTTGSLALGLRRSFPD